MLFCIPFRTRLPPTAAGW